MLFGRAFEQALSAYFLRQDATLKGIAQHYIGGTISLTGVFLNPSLPLAA
jgi:hypothetical protein